MSETKIEIDIKEFLSELKTGQKAILNKIEDIDKRLVRVETRLDSTVEDIKEIKTSQKAQIWTLIGILTTAVGGFVVAVARSVLTFNS